MKTTYEIELVGCDDYTTIYMELTSEEYELLKRVSDLSKEASEYDCMPIIGIRVKE